MPDCYSSFGNSGAVAHATIVRNQFPSVGTIGGSGSLDIGDVFTGCRIAIMVVSLPLMAHCTFSAACLARGMQKSMAIALRPTLCDRQ